MERETQRKKEIAEKELEGVTFKPKITKKRAKEYVPEKKETNSSTYLHMHFKAQIKSQGKGSE